jgi:dTDP-4-dehydrorhamnose reductase
MTEVKTILVTGSNGQLGQSLKKIANHYPQYEINFATRADLDLSESDSITHFFQDKQFDLLINCAAYTAVDKAESEAELADQINHLAVQQLAEIAQQQQAKLIHISTDYVFDGHQYRPYIETDVVAPQGVYGLTKLKGEQAVFNIMAKNAVIIRTSWVYSEFGHNFVKSMLKLASTRDALNVIYDQVGTPTYATDLAQAIMSIVQSEPFQSDFNSDLVHYSNEGVCSWYDFAKTIFELSNITCNVSPIETKDYPTAATRPHYSLLNKNKIKQHHHLTIPYWKDSLRQCCQALQETS